MSPSKTIMFNDLPKLEIIEGVYVCSMCGICDYNVNCYNNKSSEITIDKTCGLGLTPEIS